MNFFRTLYRALLAPLVDTILPPLCPVCGDPLKLGQRNFCTHCLGDIPLTYHWEQHDNEMKLRIEDSIPTIASAHGFFYFKGGSGWRTIIHNLKYKNQWRHGVTLGRWFGRELRGVKAIGAVDFVIAIPLHPFRIYGRGYNQSDYIGLGIAESLGVPLLRRGLERTRSNVSQVRLQHQSRFLNVENLFEVTDASLFEERDILLVDDVYTTGSTMLSCAEAIMKAAPSCRIHIASLAISDRLFGNNYAR